MIINLKKFPIIWYENHNGDKYIPNLDVDGYPGDNIPKGYVYQHSEFPCDVHHTILKITQEDEVEQCQHKDVVPTSGWINGVEGRKCQQCQGTQTKNINDSWPEKWCAHGCTTVMTGTSGYHKNLVVALVNPYLKQWLKAFIRNRFRSPKKYPLDKAILIAAKTCERCLNVLLYRYGIDGGYPEESDEWYRAGTSCDFCKHMPNKKPEPDTPENRMKNLLL